MIFNDSQLPQEMTRRGHLPVCNALDAHPRTGKTWYDMPQAEEVMKKLNFFFYRRGLYKPEDERRGPGRPRKQPA